MLSSWTRGERGGLYTFPWVLRGTYEDFCVPRATRYEARKNWRWIWTFATYCTVSSYMIPARTAPGPW